MPPGTIALRVPDVVEAKAKLEAAGVQVNEMWDSGVCHGAGFCDLDSNAILLHHRLRPYEQTRCTRRAPAIVVWGSVRESPERVCRDAAREVGSFAVGAEAWTWPDSLDALAAAPESHRLLFENDAVRVLETRIAPGEATQLHTHRWPGSLYVLSFGHFVRRDADGTVLVDSREAGVLPRRGTALWSHSLPPHTLENVDAADIHVIGVELKSG